MMRWYVVQVYAGYEKQAQADIRKRIQEEGLQESFGEVLIPEAKLKSLFEEEDQKDHQLFPGYILVEMDMNAVTMRIVTSSSRVLRFLGGLNPVPLRQREVNQIRSQMSGKITLTSEREDFSVGSEVEIKEGPFAGFVGIVDKVDKDSEKLTVMVSIFGRMTPVELGFHQVKQ